MVGLSFRGAPLRVFSSFHSLAAVLVALGCVTACPVSARADDGSLEAVGGAVHLMKEQGSIRMLSERVRAHISNEAIDVDCVFVMKNEGSADTVLIGFPDGPMEPYGSGDNELLSFRSWVDGSEVECRRVPDVGTAPGEPAAISWWTKRVAFARGAVRIVRDHYTVWPSWSASSATRGFEYILATGASWKGTIGSAEIVARLDGNLVEHVTGTDPEARRVGRTFHWSFRNFEPGSGDGSPASVRLEWKVPGRRGTAEEPDTLGR